MTPRAEPSEYQICVALCQALDRAGATYTHIPSEGRRDPRTGARLRRIGWRAGWPDYVITRPDGRTVWLEVKRPGGRLSRTQAQVHAQLRELGHVAITACGFADAIAQLRAAGVVG